MKQINIEIAYALPDRYYLKSFKVDEGTMIQTAILQSGILQQLPRSICVKIKWGFIPVQQN